jgi:hypothetical protein
VKMRLYMTRILGKQRPTLCHGTALPGKAFHSWDLSFHRRICSGCRPRSGCGSLQCPLAAMRPFSRLVLGTDDAKVSV